ncbi:CapA family protein [Porticoccaceae bacterium LTM1]|nr:CapA family protein [Porticoccaceae bacterium LTM1]
MMCRLARCSGRIHGGLFAILAIVAFLAVSVSLFTKASGDMVGIDGQVIDESGDLLQSGSITINGDAAQIRDGRYQIRVASKPVYRIELNIDGYYPAIHTFSPQEIKQNKGDIPSITLVSRKPDRTLFAFGGDLMTGRRLYKPLAGDEPLLISGDELTRLKQMLNPIRPYLMLADIASINLETILASESPATETPKSVTFYSHPVTLEALKWAGVDYLTLGNNHVYDFGDAGVKTTLDALTASGLGYSGGGMNEKQALKSYTIQRAKEEFSLLGFVGWKGNFTPNQVAEADKGGAAWGSDDNIVNAVTRESARGNAVVVQYHGNSEYSYGPTEEGYRRMRLAVDSGADLVIGHHPHVLHGFELYKNKLIAYSLGNFLFDQYFQETHRSALLYVWMDGDQFVRAEVVPLYIKHYQPTPAVGAVRDHILRRLKHQSILEGVQLSVSGGHAAITPNGSADIETKPGRELALQLDRQGQWSGKLSMNWQEQLMNVSAKDEISCQLGRDILVTGDFESDHGLVTQPGTWRLSNGAKVVGAGNGSEYALVLATHTDQPAVAKTRGFHRLTEAEFGITHSLLGQIKGKAGQEVEVCLEYASKKQSFTKSLAQPERECFDSIRLTNSEWQPFRVDFPAVDKATYKGYRLHLQSDSSSPVALDNLSWTLWQARGSCDHMSVGSVNEDVLAIYGKPDSELTIEIGSVQ